jgi:hypothetical protein
MIKTTLINTNRNGILLDAALRRRLVVTMLHEAGAAMTDQQSPKDGFTAEQLRALWDETDDVD